MASLRTALRRVAGDCPCSSRLARPIVASSSLALRAGIAARAPVPSASSVRAFSASTIRAREVRNKWAASPTISYSELKPITRMPNDKILLVDCREPDEVALGTIPSSVNLPLSRLDDALDANFHQAEFQHEFAFPKPAKSQNIVFFCRSGRRSGIACEMAEAMGYPNVRNYVGSWLEWEDKNSRLRSADADADDDY